MKISNINFSFIIFIKFITITTSIQIFENTTSDNNSKNTNSSNIQFQSANLTNTSSKGPVLYPNYTNDSKNEPNNLQNVKDSNSSTQNNNAEWLKKNNQNNNLTSSVKKSLGKLKKQKLRQTNIESSRPIQFKHNYVNNNKKEFIPSPEIKLSSSSEEKINQIKENESFQPSDMLIPLSVSIVTVKPFIVQQHHTTNQQYYSKNNNGQHQQQLKNIQYTSDNNNQYQNNDHQSEKDIIYGKQTIQNNNLNSQLSDGYNLKSNQQHKNNGEKSKNNHLINWPSSNDQLQDVNDSHENHKEKMHTKKSTSSKIYNNNVNQYRQSNPHVQQDTQSLYYDENVQLPETKILVHPSNNDIVHDIYNNPNKVENSKELLEQHYYINPHYHHNQQQEQQHQQQQQQHQPLNTFPIASEHPYQFESVSGKDTQYYEYQNSGIGQHDQQQQNYQHEQQQNYQHEQQQHYQHEQQQQNHQYGLHHYQQHDAQHYEQGYSNENVGVITNYGETSGHINNGEIGGHIQQINGGYHNIRHHNNYGNFLGKDFKKLVHWKKIATIFASIIPIGLLFSALTPNVVVINPNATALSKSPSPITLVQPNRQRSINDKQLKNNNNSTIKIDLNGINFDFISNKNITLNSKCIERSICELASDGNNSYILQKLLEEIQRNYRKDLFSSATLSNSPATKFTEEEFIKAAKGENCKNYECDMLT